MTRTQTTFRIAAITLVVVGVFLGALAAAVIALRDRIDSGAEASSRHYVATRLDQLGAKLGDTLVRFAHWDEAHEAAQRQNVAWLYDNIAINADRGTGFDIITMFGGRFADRSAGIPAGVFWPSAGRWTGRCAAVCARRSWRCRCRATRS